MSRHPARSSCSKSLEALALDGEPEQEGAGALDMLTGIASALCELEASEGPEAAPEGEPDPVRTLVEALLPSSKRREEAEEDAEQAPLPPSSSRATAAGKGGKGARVEVSASSAAVS